MNPWGLTERQIEVMTQIASSGSSKAASWALGISHRTVEHHVSNVKKKMKKRTALQALIEVGVWARVKCVA